MLCDAKVMRFNLIAEDLSEDVDTISFENESSNPFTPDAASDVETIDKLFASQPAEVTR